MRAVINTAIAVVSGILRVRVNAIAISRAGGVTDKVITGHQLSGQVGMVRKNAGIHDCHHHCRVTAGCIPGLRQANQGVVPLERIGLVIRCRQGAHPVVGLCGGYLWVPAQVFDGHQGFPASQQSRVLQRRTFVQRSAQSLLTLCGLAQRHQPGPAAPE